MPKWIMFIAGVAAASGCAGEVEQTEACARFVQCVEARDEQLGISTDLERFREGGPCWGSPEGQELCDVSCVNGVEYLASLEDAPGECAP